MKTKMTLLAALVAIVLSACTEDPINPNRSAVKNPTEKNSKVDQTKQ